jgi:methyltransferase (TIGR00027 family)
MTTPINDVSDTSIWVATYRALESKRADALFQDPLAEKLVGERGPQIIAQIKRSYSVEWSVIIRTLIIDDFITTAVAEGVDTILNLGAGLDTRPYRMKLRQNLKWIEVDYPHIIELKNEKLKDDRPTCSLERVKLDLGNLVARKEFFSNLNGKSKKVLVITEGVIPYLSLEETVSLGSALREQKNFSLWIVDYIDPSLMKYIEKMRRDDLKNAPFKFNPENWEQFYTKVGWKVKEMQYLSEVAINVGRPYNLPWYQKIMFRFASKKQIEKYQRMSGYAVLERSEMTR